MLEPLVVAKGVKRAYILPRASQIGPITVQQRADIIKASGVYGQYESAQESAYEKLKGRVGARISEASSPATGASEPGSGSVLGDVLDSFGLPGRSNNKTGRSREGIVEAAAKSAARAIGSQLGRQIIRGVLGSILGGRR